MSIRTTVTLDEDVVAGLKEESARRGDPFKVTLNEMIRKGLLVSAELERSGRKFELPIIDYARPRPGINFDCTSELLAMDEKLP